MTIYFTKHAFLENEAPENKCNFEPKTTRNLPYSLSTRIIRIFSKKETRNKKLNQMKSDLLEKNYKNQVTDSAIKKGLVTK